MSDFTPEQVERAAEALWKQTAVGEGDDWLGECPERWKSMFRAQAYTVLSAAGAPEKVAPVVDEAALAEVIAPHKLIWRPVSRDAAYCRCGEEYPRNGQPHIEWFELHRAAAVAAYLRGESK